MPKPVSIASRRSDLLSVLVGLIDRRTSGSGDFATAVSGLTFFRREAAAAPMSCMVEPSLVLVAQGAKQMWVGGEPVPYDTSHFLLTSLDLPAESEVLLASRASPCMGITLKLDLHLVAELVAQGGLPPRRERTQGKSVGVGAATASILSPVVRLVELLDEPDAIRVISPLIQREIHFRLLMSEEASKLRQIASVDGQGHRIARAIEWLKVHYAEQLRIEDLAARVQMSSPTFHQHFRQLTTMSPLQYQKWLRLNEARRLMLTGRLDVSGAAFKVGYESPSQFSREYARMFGNAPRRDIAEARANAQLGVSP